MKKSNLIRIALSFILLVFSVSCNTQEEKVDKAADDVQDKKEELQKAREDYEREVSEYRQSVQADIDYNKELIAKMKEERVVAKEEEIKARNERIEALQERNNELEGRMAAFKSDSRENWQEFKREFNNDMKELGDAFRDIGKDNVK